ncbi:MAG TPA: hypothetical protein VM840_02445 [Actinomycetota bacterium]|nr:hypothetical protein [Actinomycetota bacterium]
MAEETQAPPGAASLRPLLDLQQVDLAIDRLNERKETLPEKLELTSMTQRIAEVQAAVARVDAELGSVNQEMKRLDGEVQELDDKISREEKKMYSGQVTNPKEVGALSDEIAMLKRRRAPLEDADLELMVRRDELQAERAKLEAEIADLEVEAQGIRGRISDRTEEIDRELAVEDTRRAGLAGQVPPDVIDRYEELRATKRGVGVGALREGVCTACREALSAVEVDRIKRKAREGEQLFRCEHCRRLLVVE